MTTNPGGPPASTAVIETAPAPERIPRTLHVEHCMGTVFTFDIRDPGGWDVAIAEAVAGLHETDQVFSTYRAGSDVSRLRAGTLRLADAHPDVATVLGLCADLHEETDGYFSARWSGALDPTGLVKGWAVERASATLRAHGSHNHALNGGGDLRLAGHAAPGRPWRVGIVDPGNRARLITTVSGCDLAVATSGTAERGAHVVDPFTGRPAADLASLTVVGSALTVADAYATAGLAMGRPAIAWLELRPGYDGFSVDSTGTLARTSGWVRQAGH